MHEKGLLGRGGRGHTSALRAPDRNGYIIFSISESPLRRPPREPRGLGLGGPLAACFLRSPSLGSLAHGRGALIWARVPHPAHTHTPAGPGVGHRSTRRLVGGWV